MTMSTARVLVLASISIVGTCGGLGMPVTTASGRAPLAAPPGYTTTRTGSIHDFDYLVGAWTTQQRRLKDFSGGSSTWITAPANRHCATSYLDGGAIVEQSRFPDGSAAGLFLYTFNSKSQQWSIYWINGKTGQPDPPSVGGFAGDRGEFYSEDEFDGRPIKVRVTWTKSDSNHARWEQAFSFDNRTWETNWTSDFTRGDPAVLCRKR